MEALCERLGRPQDAYASLHVVGTNGKSSTATYCAEILRRAGLSTGTCLSPHTFRWSERTRIGGEEIGGPAFAAAVADVAEAVAAVESTFTGHQRITQFEAAIAVSLVAYRSAGVEVAVIEAGLGGRLDATNVIDSAATALTSVGLDHTEWLGETLAEIAAEKLAVLEAGTTLVVGELPEEVAAQAAAHARSLGAGLVAARAGEGVEGPRFLAADAAIALELARVVSADAAPLVDPGPPTLAGRAELIEGEPPVLLDAAHNADGARSLSEAVVELAPRRPLVGCLSILAGKDGEAIVAALAATLDELICTVATPGPAMGRPGAVPIDPGRLVGFSEAAGLAARAIEDPVEAVRRTLTEASRRDGTALFAGSHYLLGYVWTVRSDRNCSR